MRLFLLSFFALIAAGAQADFACPQNRDIVAGLNEGWQTHPQIQRVFHAEFPNVAPGTKVGVIFSWHGVGDSIDNWQRSFPIADYSTSQFPFIVITPDDVDLSPFGGRQGMAWDLFKSLQNDDNLEATLFESVLGCLKRNHDIAMDRVYSAGFSGGAIVSNMLHARYPNIVAAVFAASGAWISDWQQQELIHNPLGTRINMEWMPLRNEDHGAVMMTYGGKKDTYNIMFLEILNFRGAGILAKAYLRKNNRTVVVCEHDGGHHLHPALRVIDVVRFFQAHTAGKPSPYRSNPVLPQVLGSICKLG